MQTTIEILDNLLKLAKQYAARIGATLRALIEHGWLTPLREGAKSKPHRLRAASFGRGGLTPAARAAGWDVIRDWANQRGNG